MRKLATIQTIHNISPIKGADNISVAEVLGWEVVVKNGEYASGDSVIFCEIDSWIPKNIAPSLCEGKSFNHILGGRVRTKKLRGVVSQGLILPLSTLPNLGQYTIGQEVTKELGIVKWEDPAFLVNRKEAKGDFPFFIPKTEQERVQNLKMVYDQYLNKSYEVTIKLDGSSLTVYSYYDKDSKCDVSGVCSRTLELKEGHNKYWDCAKKYNVIEKLKSTGRGLAVQAEMLDVDIQSNYEKVDSLQMYVYDIYDIDNKAYLFPEERRKICNELGLPHVPVICEKYVLYGSIKHIREYAFGEGMNKGVRREGIVLKSIDNYNRFKVTSVDYLLKYKKD